MSCMFCHSLDSSHPVASVVGSMEGVGTAILMSDIDSVDIHTPERPVALKVSCMTVLTCPTRSLLCT